MLCLVAQSLGGGSEQTSNRNKHDDASNPSGQSANYRMLQLTVNRSFRSPISFIWSMSIVNSHGGSKEEAKVQKSIPLN